MRILRFGCNRDRQRSQVQTAFSGTNPISREPGDRRLHALRGIGYAATGHPADAIAELKQALDSDDDGSLDYVLAKQYQKSGNQKSAALAFERPKILRSKADPGLWRTQPAGRPERRPQSAVSNWRSKLGALALTLQF